MPHGKIRYVEIPATDIGRSAAFHVAWFDDIDEALRATAPTGGRVATTAHAARPSRESARDVA
jgi:hypothetical protein